MRLLSAVLTMILFLLGTTAATAQTTGGSEVLDPGGHTLQWNGNWTKNNEISQATVDFEGALLEGENKMFGTVVYANTLSGAEMRDIFVNAFGTSLGGYTTIDAGSDSGVHYELGKGTDVTLYAVFIDGGLGAQSLGYFVVAPSADFANAVASIQADFTLNGGPVLQGVEGNGLQQRATGGTGTTSTVPNTGVTNNTATTGNQQTQQPVNQQTQQPINQQAGQTTTTNPPVTNAGQVQTQRIVDETVFVGTTELGWTGGWVYDTSSSTPEQATFSLVDQATGTMKIITYGEFADASIVGTGAAITTFTDAFFQGAGVTNARQVDGGFLTNGNEWRLYSFNLEGLDLSLFVTGSQNPNGMFVITTATANTVALQQTLGQVQQDFSLNRTMPVLDGVDPIQVTIGLQG